MADEHELPDDRPEITPPAPPTPPAKKAPAKAVKKAPVKKAPAKKAPAKKAPAKKAPVKKAPAQASLAAVANSNGTQPGGGAGPVTQVPAPPLAPHHRSPVLVPPPDRRPAALPIAVAVAISVLVLLLIRQLRRGHDD